MTQPTQPSLADVASRTTPRLTTPRLALVPFSRAHLTERYVGWLKDPEVVQWSEQRYRSHSLDSCASYYASFATSPDYFFALEAGELGHVGNLNVSFDTRHHTADIGILLGERAIWGKGYGTEAWQVVLKHLLEDRKVRKVTGGCVADNKGMVTIMERSGMAPDGRRTGHYVYDGRPVDLVYYATFAAQGTP